MLLKCELIKKSQVISDWINFILKQFLEKKKNPEQGGTWPYEQKTLKIIRGTDQVNSDAVNE